MFSSTSNESESNKCKSKESLYEWESRIKSVQESRVSPEVRQRILESGERQKRAIKSVKTATRLERANILATASNTMTLQRFCAPSSAVSAPQQYHENATKHSKWSGQLQKAVTPVYRSASNHDNAKSYQQEEDDDEEERDRELDSLEAELRSELMVSKQNNEVVPTSMDAVFGFAGMQQHHRQEAAAAISSDLSSLLQQLAVEPTNDAEIAAKFSLFEAFLATVVTIREETLKFWESNKDQFTGGSRISAEAEIRKLDDNDSMGIVDDPRKWFVYSMTIKASENSRKMTKTLASLRANLELLSQEMGECPYCLDVMTADASTVLGCCHRVCTDCWNHWVEMKGNAAFCPLCRHEEFVAEILTPHR